MVMALDIYHMLGLVDSGLITWLQLSRRGPKVLSDSFGYLPRQEQLRRLRNLDLFTKLLD